MTGPAKQIAYPALNETYLYTPGGRVMILYQRP
jgi:hypothetical protein